MLPLVCLLPQTSYAREEAGTHRYNVGTDTPKVCATSYGGVPLAKIFLAAPTLLSVIRRFRPPMRLVDLEPPNRRDAVRTGRRKMRPAGILFRKAI